MNLTEVESFQRPNGFEKERRDCVIRALSLAANLDYAKVHTAFKNVGRKNGHGILVQKVLQKVCKELNIHISQVKRSGTAAKLIEDYPQGNLFCLKRGHTFAIINGIPHNLMNIKSHIKGAWICGV